MCIKVLLVVFFGFPTFNFMLLRFFLSLDTMKKVGQLVCANNRHTDWVPFQMVNGQMVNDESQDRGNLPIGMIFNSKRWNTNLWNLHSINHKGKHTLRYFYFSLHLNSYGMSKITRIFIWKSITEIVRKDDNTFEFQATLAHQECSSAQELFFGFSQAICGLVLLQILFLLCRLCYSSVRGDENEDKLSSAERLTQ